MVKSTEQSFLNATTNKKANPTLPREKHVMRKRAGYNMYGRMLIMEAIREVTAQKLKGQEKCKFVKKRAKLS